MKLGLSVVIPAYNEEANIGACIDEVYRILKKTDWDWEILVVNDGSKDNTGRKAREQISKLKIKQAKLLDNNPNRGYGGSLKRGFEAATKEFIAFIPADNQFDFEQIHTLVAKQQASGADIVSGIREKGGSDPIHRLLFRWGWNLLIRSLFGYLAADVDCGFKLFRRSILNKLSLPSNGAMIDTQFFAGSKARGYKVAEVPVTHLPRVAGASTGGNPKVIIKAIKELLLYWWWLNNNSDTKVPTPSKIEIAVIIFILIISASVRLYRINDFMTFLGDEGRDAIVMRDIMLGQHFPLIGPGTSIGSMYLGPLYYYLVAPSLAISNFSPLGPAVFISFIGVLTVGLLWWIIREWSDSKSALLASLLFALSPTVIQYSRSSWNPNIMPFFALLSVYSIWKVWQGKSWKWLLLTSVCLAFVLNSHYLGLLLIPVVGLYWLLSVRKTQKHTAIKYSFYAAVALAILLSPLLFFDLRHDFQNMTAIKTFFSARQTTVNLKAYKAIPNILPLWQNINTSLLTGRQSVYGEPLSIFIILAAIYVIIRKPSSQYILTLFWLGFGLIGLGLYKQHIYDHYFGFLFPVPFILIALIIKQFWQSSLLRFVSILLVFYLFYSTLTSSFFRSGPNYQLSRTRTVSDFITQNSQGQPFNLALVSDSNYDASYRYFMYLNKAPIFTIHEKLSQQLYVICEKPNCQPIGSPLWEIAAFGWAKIDNVWSMPWGVKIYRLIPNPLGK